MKIILTLASLILLSINAYPQKIILPLRNREICYEETIQLPDTTVSAEKLYRLAQVWVANQFSNSKSVILISDMGSEKIIGTRVVFYRQRFKEMPATYLHYTIAIDIKNGKYRYQIFDILFQRDQSQIKLSEEYSNYLNGNMSRMFLEGKKKVADRYEEKFSFADKVIATSILSLKTQMSDLTADKF